MTKHYLQKTAPTFEKSVLFEDLEISKPSMPVSALTGNHPQTVLAFLVSLASRLIEFVFSLLCRHQLRIGRAFLLALSHR